MLSLPQDQQEIARVVIHHSNNALLCGLEMYDSEDNLIAATGFET
jgi:hypothetical protein